MNNRIKKNLLKTFSSVQKMYPKIFFGCSSADAVAQPERDVFFLISRSLQIHRSSKESIVWINISKIVCMQQRVCGFL